MEDCRQPISYRPIGGIRTPHTDPAKTPIQPRYARGVEGRIDIDPAFEEDLDDLDEFSHIVLLCHLHRARPFRLKVVPFLDDVPRGIFCTTGAAAGGAREAFGSRSMERRAHPKRLSDGRLPSEAEFVYDTSGQRLCGGPGGQEVSAVMRLVSRTLHPILLCLALAVAVQAAPCCVNTPPPSAPTIRVLIPDSVADRWYACRGVAEEDLGITIVLDVMPTSQEGRIPRPHPIDVMREVIYQMIDEDDLPDMAMLPRELAREISDRCYVYDLDAFECWLTAPFYYDGAVDGIELPWAVGLVVVFFEPGTNVTLGLELLRHPVIASQRPPAGCCDWPPPPPEPVCPCPPWVP